MLVSVAINGKFDFNTTTSTLLVKIKELNCGGLEWLMKSFAIKEVSVVIASNLLGTAAKSKVVHQVHQLYISVISIDSSHTVKYLQ